MKKILIIVISILLCISKLNASTSIDVTKKLNSVDNISNTFNYSVVAKDTNPELVSNFPSSFSLEFSNDDIENKNAIKTYTLDFKDVNYTKLGRYEYVVSEISSSNEEVYPIDTNKYTIVVNVVNELDDNNEPTGNKIIDVLGLAFFNDGSGKSNIVFETNPLTYMTLSKKVTGDLSDANEYFKFKIDISEGDNYLIKGQDEVVNYNGEIINTSNTYNASSDNYVYLKHGQSLTIGLDDNNNMHIPSNTEITIEELESENYKTFINNSNTPRKSIFLNALNTPQSNTISYVNNYESNVLTGLFVNNAPYIILVILSIVGFVLIRKKAVK